MSCRYGARPNNPTDKIPLFSTYDPQYKTLEEAVTLAVAYLKDPYSLNEVATKVQPLQRSRPSLAHSSATNKALNL